jgi:peptidoglycan/LPS O-acetylase OafA/YrhL
MVETPSPIADASLCGGTVATVEPAARAASTSRGAAPAHLTHVEGMRALAAYVVFVNHAYAQTWNPGRGQFPPWGLSPFTYSLVAGHLSVTVFIVISGFCLMLPVVRAGNRLRGGTVAFLKRRARRILPPYYGALAFCLLSIWTIIGKPTGTLWDVPIERSTVAILSHLVLLQDLFGTGKINYVFWSIAVEWQIYFLFPVLVWSWRRFGPTVTVAVALVVGYGLRLGFAHTRLARAAPQYLGLFALGMLAAYLVRSDDSTSVRVRDRFPWSWVCVACVALVGLLSGLWGWERAVDRFYVLDLPVGIGAMSLLVLTSRDRGSLVTRILSWRPLVFIGTFSYSLYLIHAPLLQMIWQYVLAPAHLSPVAIFAALMGPGALAILVGSYGFFRVCEEPFMGHSAARGLPGSAVASARGPGDGLVPAPVAGRRGP